MQTQPPADYSLNLSVELVQPSSIAQEPEKLVLSFEGVRKLRILQADWSVLQFPLLEFRDIRSRQLEGLGYEVVDNEDGVLSFMCKDFAFQVERK